MKVIIIGAGKVGLHIAQTLSNENHDITIIDKNDDIGQNLDNSLDILAIVGNGANEKVLLQAGIKEADIFIAVTRADEINMIACMIAKQHNSSINTIARIRNSEYIYNDALFKEKLNIDYVINPERAAAKEIVRLLKTPSNVCETHDLAGGILTLFGLNIDENCRFVNKKIKNIPFGKNTIMTAIFRENNLIALSGNQEILVGDRIYLLTKKGYYSDLELFCTKKNNILQNVIIFGGSNIGIQVASMLNEIGIKNKLIEIDKQKCENISELLPQTLLINGDGTNIDLLKEEGIENTDGFVAVTGYDEENLLVSLLAKHLGTKKVIAKISRTNYIPIVEKIGFGLDAVINPRLTTISEILRFLKRDDLTNLTLLEEGDLEIVELIVHKESKINNKPLKMVSFPNSTIIGAIIRDQEVIIPHGKDYITEGDRVIIFVKVAEIKKIEQLFY